MSASELTPLVTPTPAASVPPRAAVDVDNNGDPEAPPPPPPPPADDESPHHRRHEGAYHDATPTWRDMVGKVSPYVRPADKFHVAAAVVALVSVLTGKILNVLPPLAIKYAVDEIGRNALAASAASSSSSSSASASDSAGIIGDVATASARPVLLALAVYFALKVTVMANSALQDLAQRYVALDAERRFGCASFAHLHNLSLSYHLEKHIGEITRVMNRGTDSVSTLISSFLFYLAPTVFEAAVVSAVFWKLGTPSIALSTVAAVVLYLTFTIIVTKTRIAYRRKLIEANDAVGQKETETLVNYETVSMFGRTSHEIDAYGTLRQTYKDRRVDMLSMFALLELGQKFIRLTGVCAGLAIAGYATVHGSPGGNGERLTAGSFVVIQMYIDQLFQPLSMLGWQYRMLTQAFTDLEKAVTMLNRVPEVQDAPDAVPWKVERRRQKRQRRHRVGADKDDDVDGDGDSDDAPVASSGEVVFANVSFHYKVDSRRRDLGGSLNVPYSGGRRGFGRHGGRRGRIDLVDAANGNNKTKNQKRTKGGGKRGADGGNDEDEKKEDGDDGEKREDNVDKPPARLGGVDDLSFRVPAGKTAALVGHSGSGKTTIVRLVLRMYDPDEGAIYVDGRDVRSLTMQSLRENIGVVAQETILFNASIRDNVTYGKPDASEEEVWDALRTSALEEFVNGLPDKLDTIVGERGMKLSGGERQRVGLARCVIKDPQLILLDEATSALDSATEREIQRHIADVCRGRTTIMIAHRLSTARNADEIIVLEKGKISERGSHDELLRRNQKYAKMWKIQTEPSN